MRESLFEIPFVYQAMTLETPRHRKQVPVFVLDSLPVKIRVMDEADLPVAFRFASSVGRHDSGPPSPCVDIRWDGSRLFMTDPGVAPTGAEGLAAALASRRGTPFAGVQANGPEWCVEIPRSAMEMIVVSDNRADRAREVLRAVGGVLVHGGRFWSASAEPVWQARSGFSGTSVEARLATGDTLSEKNACSLFPADRLEDAISSVSGAKRRGSQVYTYGRLEVLIPKAMSLPLDDLQLAGALRRAVMGSVKDLAARPAAFMAAFAEARDALASCPSGRTTERLAAAARRFGSELKPMDDFYYRAVTEAYDRWADKGLPAIPGDGAPEDAAAVSAPRDRRAASTSRRRGRTC